MDVASAGAGCREAAPAGQWQTLTFMSGWRADRMPAPGGVHQAMNGEAFKEYLRAQPGPGDIVRCDKLPAPKGRKSKLLVKRKARR